ncbi:RidA family protein [Mesorhizobium sp. B2-4-17]|uniref:RidA family protein n=1 Tax=Mesorhizobium sp. B2-4-17 TaxID=2589932 RepID=UPI00112AF20A|nr:RidA family protein [Mesorhizobium sp. B2-4-17]TPK91501.1 RidA family protein [Mesorhizobium sp. B2-4-17]
MSKQAIAVDSPIFRGADGKSIFEKFGYSAAVRAGDFIYVAGQIGLNPDGSLPDSDETQFRNAFDRLDLILKEAGSSLDDTVELVSYHVGLQKEGHLAGFVKVKTDYIAAPHPTWTILGIDSLARPGLVIEIKAVAYAPAR